MKKSVVKTNMFANMGESTGPKKSHMSGYKPFPKMIKGSYHPKCFRTNKIHEC